MNKYSTLSIYRGIYANHSNCLDAIKRNNINLIMQDGNTLISEADYISLLKYRLGSSRDKNNKEVITRLKTFGIEVPKETVNIKPKRKASKSVITPNKSTNIKSNINLNRKVNIGLLWHQRFSKRLIELMTTIANFFAEKPVIFFALIGALGIQVRHLAILAQRVGGDDGIVISYAFAIVSEITALLLVVHGSTKNMLLIFAVFQCTINLLYYIDLPLIITKVTLSVLITIVVYSYSHLYAKELK